MKTSSPKTSRTLTLALLGFCLGLLTLTGCQTMNGAGKDIERAGEKIQDNAKR